ncbi:DUF3253 domain-containing protein [Lutimaribacter marinistellae]|uniref:DUF3253 domain-containing protein n=1 Tax=Lutimaribacter marinistellae TaxID=1820329 RepID=A0ABV7THA3_9RHOB
MTQPSDDIIAQAILDLAHRRGVGKTFCPSDIARNLVQDWRPLMTTVRSVAGRLVLEGRIEATQKGLPVDPESATGPIRLGLPRG